METKTGRGLVLDKNGEFVIVEGPKRVIHDLSVNTRSSWPMSTAIEISTESYCTNGDGRGAVNALLAAKDVKDAFRQIPMDPDGAPTCPSLEERPLVRL